MDEASFRTRRTWWRWAFFLGGLVWFLALVTADPLAEGAIEYSTNLLFVQVGGIVWIAYAGHLWYRAAAYVRLYRSTDWSNSWGSDPAVPIPRAYQPYVNATVVALFGVALVGVPYFLGAVG